LIVCGLLLLTSIKMDIVNIDIDKNIDRVRSAIEKRCPVSAPDAILRIMFSGRHISVNWTILCNYSSVLFCDLYNQQI